MDREAMMKAMQNIDREEIVKASDSMSREAFQKLFDYLTILDLISQNQGTEEQAADLASEANRKWWAENKGDLLA